MMHRICFDFTLASYERLCSALLDAGYRVLPLADFLEEPRRPDLCAVLRHDVDRWPGHALAMARLERRLGIASTYYVRLKSGAFDPEIITAIAAMGHEVGYHYETLSDARGDVDHAIKLFSKNMERLRRICPVRTISMHGRPLSSFDNRALWVQRDFREFGLIGEAYLSLAQSGITYLNDTGRTWGPSRANRRDHLPGSAEPQDLHTTNDVVAAVSARRFSALCLSCHPERWNDRLPSWILSAAMDLACNCAKSLLNPFGRQKRRSV